MHDHAHAHFPQAVSIAFGLVAATSVNAGQVLALFIAVCSFGVSLVRFRWDWEDRRARQARRHDHDRDRDRPV